MEAGVPITVAVQNYRLAYPGGHSRFLLQSPIPVPNGHHESDRILARHEQGPNNNKVVFELSQRLVKVDGPPDRAYAHGILRGDPVWVDELLSDTADGPYWIAVVVNLRTWERLHVELADVRWIPKYRKRDHGDNEDELLTVCGAPFRKRSIRLRAIVQRLARSSGTLQRALEIRDFVEKDLFEYDNLNKLSDGKTSIEDIFDRILASMESPPMMPPFFSSSFTGSDGSLTQFSSPAPPSSTLFAVPSLVNKASALATPPLDDDDSSQAGQDDPEFERDATKLWNKGMTLIRRRRKPIVSLHRTCNLPAHACPTPSRIFLNTATRPSHTNRAPTHHHLLDAECALGARHAIHCVFASAKSRDCIVPFSVRHTCCRPRAFPWNKQIRRPPPPETITQAPAAAGSVVVKGGSGVTVVGGAEEYADLPVEVRPLGLDPRRDADAVGLQMLGLTEEDLVEKMDQDEDEEQIEREESVADVDMDNNIENNVARCFVDLTEENERLEEPDAFGDRQIYGDDDDDDDDDDDGS